MEPIWLTLAGALCFGGFVGIGVCFIFLRWVLNEATRHGPWFRARGAK